MVVRALYTDCILDFTPSTTTFPTAVHCAAIVTAYYKGGYTAMYGPNTYEAVETDSFIDTEEFKNYVIDKASLCINDLATEKPDRPRGPTKEEMYEMAMMKTIGIRHASYEDENLEQIGDGL